MKQKITKSRWIMTGWKQQSGRFTPWKGTWKHDKIFVIVPFGISSKSQFAVGLVRKRLFNNFDFDNLNFSIFQLTWLPRFFRYYFYNLYNIDFFHFFP